MLSSTATVWGKRIPTSPLTPFTVHVYQAHQTVKGRILVIRRVDNAGRWENGSIGPLPVFDTLLSEVDDVESP